MLTDEARAAALTPMYWIADQDDAKELAAFENSSWMGPEGFEDQFKKLWLVE